MAFLMVLAGENITSVAWPLVLAARSVFGELYRSGVVFLENVNFVDSRVGLCLSQRRRQKELRGPGRRCGSARAVKRN